MQDGTEDINDNKEKENEEEEEQNLHSDGMGLKGLNDVTLKIL